MERNGVGGAGYRTGRDCVDACRPAYESRGGGHAGRELTDGRWNECERDRTAAFGLGSRTAEGPGAGESERRGRSGAMVLCGGQRQSAVRRGVDRRGATGAARDGGEDL